MFKSIMKEIFIIILLIIVILLMLSIGFYEYSPTSKKTPNKVKAYAIPEEVQNELDEIVVEDETQSIIKTYRVDAQDLKIYEKSKDYEKGNPNPFEKIKKETVEDTNNTNNTGNDNNTNTTNDNNNSNTTNNSNQNNTSQNIPQGNFLNNVGK